LKLDWMNCLSTQHWEKRLFSIFVWRILGKKKDLSKLFKFRNSIFTKFLSFNFFLTKTIKKHTSQWSNQTKHCQIHNM
jgi:hypothetical protein